MLIHNHESIPLPPYRENELDERLVGMPAVNPFAGYVSGPRAAMYNKHISQRPPLINPTTQRLFTGTAFEMGKYTYKLQMPDNAYIIAVVKKYPNMMVGANTFRNPLETVIFECAETNTIDCLDLERFHSSHQYFGFEYQYDSNAKSLIYEGSRAPAGLIIADSPAKDPKTGEYKFGIHANIALVSDPVMIEDGIKISESFANRLQFDLFETREIQFNSNAIGLNMYGDQNTYKLFPNIGEKIREDGILFATREREEGNEVSDLSYISLMKPTLYDTCIYGKPGAEVIDVEVIKGDLSKPVFLSEMETQLDFHHNSMVNYYKSIYEVYLKLSKQYGGALNLSFKFSRLVREAIAILRSNVNKLTYRGRDKLTGWKVKVTYKYSRVPTDGFKLTNTMGGKGVICHVCPDEQMPVNKIGIRADILMDNQSPYKRTIMGTHHEIYINAALDKLIHDVKLMVEPNNPSTYEVAYNHILGFYKIVSPKFYQLFLDNPIDVKQHVDSFLKNDVAIWLPLNNPVDYMEVIELLERYYPAVDDKVTYISPNTGELVETVNPIIIGGCYMMMLDKIAVDNAAVSSSRTQHFGIPAKLSKTNKYHSPVRDQPTKSIAEDESRVLEATVGGRLTAEMLDQTNNPDVHREILRSIYKTDKPSALDVLVDRTQFPTGHGNIQNMVNNILECAGVEFSPTLGDD